MNKRRIFGAVALIAGAVLGIRYVARAQSEPVATHMAVITTTRGDIRLELYGNDAPKAVKNFVDLANKGFYRGIRFHRVVPQFVIQAGDPKSRDTSLRSQWGTGGESIYGKPFEDELNPNAPSYKRGYVEGTLAMANRGPNTNTSQFFIVLNNDVKLQKRYTIFGRVTEGMEVVKMIEKLELSDTKAGLPIDPAMILDVKITEAAPAGK